MMILKLSVFLIVATAIVASQKTTEKPKEPWEVNPQVNRDETGNTNAGVEIKRHGDDHDFEAGWNKVVNGPGKAKPTWHVGGTIRFRRSPKEPWEVSPQVGRDENGNTNAGVEVKRQDKNSEINAGWNKVVRGPGKAKPTWHVGGSFRFKRSPKEPWEVSPQVGRDENGNTNAGVEVKRQDKNSEINAGWNKVVRGPGKAKPTWHVGGSFRFRRSPKEPWEVSPQVGRDENGNTNAGVEVKRQDKNSEINAGWNKVVRGPGKAKPTWHVGGSFRFRRSPFKAYPQVNRDSVYVNRPKDKQIIVESGWGKDVRFRRSPKEPWEVSPQVGRDENGNTNAGVEVKRQDKNSEINAGWNKVVRGPGKAKPTWHVGGSFRFKRSPFKAYPQVNKGSVFASRPKDKQIIIEGGWGKVVRLRRSPKEPWEVSPQVNRDENGNTNAGVEVKRHGDNHDFEAGWNKVVRGPNRSKPTWHVGGTYKF